MRIHIYGRQTPPVVTYKWIVTSMTQVCVCVCLCVCVLVIFNRNIAYSVIKALTANSCNVGAYYTCFKCQHAHENSHTVNEV